MKNIILIAPGCDGQDVGESWSNFQWVKGIAQRHHVTVLTLRRHNQIPLAQQIPGLDVVEWNDYHLPPSLERFNSMAKPCYVSFYVHARNWLKDQIKSGRQIDLIHQLGPLALRYPSPAIDLGVPYIIGPVGGSLETPLEFAHEFRSEPWYLNLRRLDSIRIESDPLLRRTYSNAACVIAVAPYVKDVLASIPVKRYEFVGETGIEALPQPQDRPRPTQNQMRLLYVGRAVRSKGLRDAVRAISHLTDLPHVTLTAIGAGPDLDACVMEAYRLKVTDRVQFLGKLPRAKVERYYRESDAFLFPSFREPSGNVVFEAMSHGLPVITSDRGGPAHVVTDRTGFRLSPENPTQYPLALAGAIRKLAASPSLQVQMRANAQRRVANLALWSNKIEQMDALYSDVLESEKIKAAARTAPLFGYSTRSFRAAAAH